jgi:predicted dienelactone hydrolase
MQRSVDLTSPSNSFHPPADRAAAPHRIALATGVLAAIFLCAPSTVLAFANESPDALGPNKVGHREMSIFDAARANRELPLQIWYPADSVSWDAGPNFTLTPLVLALGITSTVAKDDVALASASYPLIVFSHGFGGFNIQSLGLMEHLASHGFVVVAPNHTGNTQDDQSSPDPEADRYPDIALVIDELIAENLDPGSPYFGHVDGTNAGVAGHSYGGMTAMFMAAGHDGNPPDTRVNAIMPIAASSANLTDSEIEGITVPTLLMVGTLDGLQAETIRSHGLISSAPDLFRVDVVGANHTHFANVCDIGNTLLLLFTIEEWPGIGAGALVPIYQATCIPPAFPIEEASRIQNMYAAAHFRRYLLGEVDYDVYLTESYATTFEPDVDFFGPQGPAFTPALGGFAHGLLASVILGAGLVAARSRRSVS